MKIFAKSASGSSRFELACPALFDKNRNAACGVKPRYASRSGFCEVSGEVPAARAGGSANSARLINQFVDVRILQSLSHSLRGEIVTQEI